ncbi:MAG: carboxypeptidase-like regulatory domain-containing protein [Acidobacteriota bacterium]|nr:carboxypeptidase-like regulatory domain-containing protein [Acidobacteriota bacterium]
MLRLISQRVVFLIIFTLVGICQASDGSVTGLVTDEKGTTFDGVAVFLQDTKGSRYTALTEEGSYRFDNLEPGTYILYPERLPGYRITSPPCGYYIIYVGAEDGGGGGSGGYNFTLQRGAGVMIDFGSVSGGGGSSKMTDAADGGNLKMEMDIFNVSALDPAPQLVIITGYYMAPGHGALTPKKISGTQAGAYVGSDLRIATQIVAGPVVKIILSYPKNPHIDMDGLIAALSLQLNDIDLGRIRAAGSRLSFCMTSLEVFQGKGITQVSSDAILMEVDDQ